MKSAYELAMERLQKSAPSVPLTEEQRQEIAGIDERFRARIAEREIFLQGELAKARASADPSEAAAIEKQLASELRRLREECEEKKEAVRRRKEAP
jgi:hypothetical protein